MKSLKGIHHVTAMTSSAEKIYEFFTYILGMRLVKKTVNQDDIQTYHLFFADDLGSPGTDMTFFDFPNQQKAIKGNDEISKTGFRVTSDIAIDYWKKRFEELNVKHQPISWMFGIKMLEFEDFDGQEYVLVSDENDKGIKSGTPWKNGPIPNEFAITGLGPIFFRIQDEKRMNLILTRVLGFEHIATENSFTLYQTGEKGNGSSVIVEASPIKYQAIQGYGGIHHVAFRIEDQKELNEWIQHLNSIHARHSGFVDRFYFKSLYTRLYPYILFEFATEGPGFIDDEEAYENLGETLALPPRFRNQSEIIHKQVRHFDTKRSHIKFEKAYHGFNNDEK